MTELSMLFKGSETWWGIFYPKKYIIATFPSFATAMTASRALQAVGFGADEVRAVSSSEMLRFFIELRMRTGLLGYLMSRLSRFIGTEASFVERDIREAQHGAGFLAVHCSVDREAHHLCKLLLPLHPVAMQWYRIGSVESLV
jgi:hypothetical protein